MKGTTRTIIVTVLVTVMLTAGTAAARAQDGEGYPSYQVKAGDSKTYELTKYSYRERDSMDIRLEQEDGSQENVVVKIGGKIDIIICEMNGTSEPGYRIEINGTSSKVMELWENQLFMSCWVIQAVDNRTYWEERVEEFRDIYSETQGASIKIEDEIFTVEAYFLDNSSGEEQLFVMSNNWKNGWLEHMYYRTNIESPVINEMEIRAFYSETDNKTDTLLLLSPEMDNLLNFLSSLAVDSLFLGGVVVTSLVAGGGLAAVAKKYRVRNS